MQKKTGIIFYFYYLLRTSINKSYFMRKFRSFFTQLVLSTDLSDRGKQCNIVCAQHPVSLPFRTMRLDKSSTTNGALSRGDCAEGVGGSLPVWKKSLQHSRGTWNPAAKALFSPFLLIARFSSCVIDLEKKLFLRLCGLGNYRFANPVGVAGCKNDICPRPDFWDC